MSTATAIRLWADGPFELLPISLLKSGKTTSTSFKMARDMLTVHNAVIRGINAIYLQCVNIERSPADINDFVEFSQTWALALQTHHHSEETVVFPRLEKLIEEPGFMDKNVEQHHAFHAGIEAFTQYLRSVSEGSQAYAGVKIRELVDAFMPALREHLSDEIGTLLALEKYEDKVDLGTWFRNILEEVIAKASDTEKNKIVPMHIHCHDGTYGGGMNATWPAMPWFVGLMFTWIIFPKNKHLWRFAPCADRKPRVLPFA